MKKLKSLLKKLLGVEYSESLMEQKEAEIHLKNDMIKCQNEQIVVILKQMNGYYKEKKEKLKDDLNKYYKRQEQIKEINIKNNV